MRVVPFPRGGERGAGREGAEAAASPGRVLPLVVEKVSYAAGGARLVHDVSFELKAGRRTAILGYNGAGKSLVLRLCHGLLKPAAGRIVWKGPRGHDPAAVKQAQAMVFQKPVLLRRTVRENLTFVLKARGVAGARARDEQVEAALLRCGLAHLARRPARALSGGEQQKLALARAWLLKPEVLFLDEPTAALDPAATLEVEAIINDMFSAGATIFFSTHDMAQARRMADHVLFIHHGRLLEDVSARAFFAGPGSAAARAFLNGELCP